MTFERDLKQYLKNEDAANRIVNQWKSTGLLNKCKTFHQEKTLAFILENQNKEILHNGADFSEEARWSLILAVLYVFNKIYDEYSCIRHVSLPANLHFYKDFYYDEDGLPALMIESRAFVVYYPFVYDLRVEDIESDDFAERAYQATKTFLDKNFDDENETLYFYIPFCFDYEYLGNEGRFSFRGAIQKEHAFPVAV